MGRRPASLQLLLLLLLGRAFALPPPAGLPAATDAALRRIMASRTLSGGPCGAYVVAIGQRPMAALAAGTFGLLPYEGVERPELFSRNPDYPVVPASNMKLFTAAAALDVLGEDYWFNTRVAAAAAPVDGVVSDLWLIGGGDPSLDYQGLAALARAVHDAGVLQVTGSVYGDTSRYGDRYGHGWQEADKKRWYGAEATALALRRNHVDVYVASGGAPGRPASVWIDPPNSYLEVKSTAVTSSSGTAVGITRAGNTRRIVVSGRVNVNQTTPVTQGVAVAECELYAAVVMSDLLRQAGVEVTGPPRVGATPGDAVEVARYESPPVGFLLQRMLKRSDNLYAELFLRELGHVAFGHGTVDGGGRAVFEFLSTYGISTRGLRVADGSGLSRSNRVTVRATAGVLRAMAFHAYRDTFWSALPIAGVDGTLSHRLNSTPAAGNVRAKTGYIGGCTSLSGYATTQAGDLLVVSTIFNHHGSASAARSLHDQLFARLAEAGR